MTVVLFEKCARRAPVARLAIAAGTMALLSACGGEPPPTTQLAVAQTAVQDAAKDGAAQRAPQQFMSAQEKLDRADEAAKSKNYTDARRLAEEAEADAHVAAATSRAMAAQTALGTVRQGNATIQQQLQQQQQPATP